MADLQIDKFVLRKTTKCERSFICLAEDHTSLCEVIAQNKFSKVAKIKNKPDLSCPYGLSLNTLHYCLCPTRVEIYKKCKK